MSNNGFFKKRVAKQNPDVPKENQPDTQWRGMPEFVQDKQEPYAMFNVRFNNEEELQEFAELIGQPLTKHTKAIWHPQLVRGLHGKKRYVDED